MNPQQLTKMYEDAVALAEAGQHQQALAGLMDYLAHRPQDGQAINDAATVLYCLGRTAEAIACYEKAVRYCQGEQLTQVYWNLCEAYLQDGRVDRAIGLFDAMDAAGLLTADTLNRAANILLDQNTLGPAVELLLRSLQLNEDQEILNPILEVIVSKRARVAVVAARQSVLARSLADDLRHRLPLSVFTDDEALSYGALESTDVAVYMGCGRALAGLASNGGPTRSLAVLDAQDMQADRLRHVNWSALHTVILCGGEALKERFEEQVETFPAGLRVVTVDPVCNPHAAAFKARPKGKRIAAVGPWDARRNPMLAVMCFQKLHYLDPDTRLHLAGAFTDDATECYIRSMLETLDLDTVVFLDGPVEDLKKWFKDKHYLLSTAIDGAGLEDVWMAAACGLRPMVHTFPGAEALLPGEWLFTLAEEFCEKIVYGPYDAHQHRLAAAERFYRNGLEGYLTESIFHYEKEKGAPCQLPTEPLSDTRAIPVRVEPTRDTSIEKLASDALAASQKLNSLTASPTSYEPVTSYKQPQQDDALKVNLHQPFSVEELVEQGRSDVPFPAHR